MSLAKLSLAKLSLAVAVLLPFIAAAQTVSKTKTVGKKTVERTVDEMIEEYVKLGNANSRGAHVAVEQGALGTHLSCGRALARMGRLAKGDLGPDKLEPIMKWMPNEGGYLVFRKNSVYFLKMDDTEIRKMERCRRKGTFVTLEGPQDGFSFTMDLGEDGKYHMTTSARPRDTMPPYLNVDDGPPSKKQVPFECSVRPKARNTPETRAVLEAWIASMISGMSRGIPEAIRALDSAKREYRDAAARPKLPIGEDMWMDFRYGRAITNASADANPSYRQLVLQVCKDVDSPAVKEAVDKELAAIADAVGKPAQKTSGEQGKP